MRLAARVGQHELGEHVREAAGQRHLVELVRILLVLALAHAVLRIGAEEGDAHEHREELMQLEDVVIRARVGLRELAHHGVEPILVGDQVGLDDEIVELLHVHVGRGPEQ